MSKTKKVMIAGGISTTVISMVAAILIAGNIAISTVNNSEAIPVPRNATAPGLSPTDENVVALLNNATKEAKSGNSTQALLDVINAVQMEHSLRTSGTTQTMLNNNQTFGKNVTSLVQ
jgi:hypothetical protein